MSAQPDVARHRAREANRRYQARHRAAGLCCFCARPAMAGRMRCRYHSRQQRQYQQAAYYRLMVSRCRGCRQPLSEPERRRRWKYHRPCLAARIRQQGRENYHRYKATAWYRRVHRAAARRYQARHWEAGRCAHCPRPARRGRVLCRSHAEAARRRYQMRRANHAA